jgi:hypothetical protein
MTDVHPWLDQLLEAWHTNCRINLFLIDHISDEGMQCTLLGGREEPGVAVLPRCLAGAWPLLRHPQNASCKRLELCWPLPGQSTPWHPLPFAAS